MSEPELRGSVSLESSALVAALEEIGRVRARREGDVDGAIASVSREEAINRKAIEEGHRRLLALRAVRREQEERRGSIAAEVAEQEVAAVRSGMALDRERFLARVRLVQEAVDAREASLAMEIEGPEYATSVREYENFVEAQPGLMSMPAPIRKQVMEQHERLCRKLDVFIKGANATPPPLAVPPLGVAVLAATDPEEGRPEALLVVLPVPYSVFSDWRDRREDLATQLTYRLLAGIFRALGTVGAPDALVNYDEVHGNLAIQVWLGDHVVDGDLRERMLEQIAAAYEDAAELWAAGVEIYGVWVRPGLLTGDSSG